MNKYLAIKGKKKRNNINEDSTIIAQKYLFFHNEIFGSKSRIQIRFCVQFCLKKRFFCVKICDSCIRNFETIHFFFEKHPNFFGHKTQA